MNMRYILATFILIVSMIGLGCVDKSSEDILQNNISTEEQVQVNNPESIKNSDADNSGKESLSDSDNANINDSEHVSENDNVNSADNESVQADNEPTSEVVNDTSVTETFKIGDQKNMLGANIKLVDIIDYDNNTATVSIDNKEYKYDPESDNIIKSKVSNGKNIEIIDISTMKEDQTAEITVDYESLSEDESTEISNDPVNVSGESTSSDESKPVDTSNSLNDTSVTDTFKIGDQKNMLGVDIKLVNIIDFNSNIVTLDIDNTEYKYDPSSGKPLIIDINGKSIEVVDLVTIEDDNAVEITVDYAKK